MAPARRRAAKNGAAAKEAAAEESTAGQRSRRQTRGRGKAEPEPEVEVEPEEPAADEPTDEPTEPTAAAATATTDEPETTTADGPVTRLRFNETLSWRPGKPIATEVLIRRLDSLSRELSDLDQETFDAESLTKVAKELANHNLLNHKDKGVKAFAAACLVDILCLCAPNAPFTQTQLQDVFGLFIGTILPALQDPSNTYDAQNKYVLHSLSEVRSIVLLNDLDNSDALQLQLFSSLFDAVSAPKNVSGGRLPTDVEHDISEILICLIEEGSSVPPKVVDVIMAQFLRAAAPGALREKGVPDKDELDRYQSTLLLKEEPPAYQIAKLICLTCADKMTRSVAQYFSDVIIDFSSVGGGKSNGHKGSGGGGGGGKDSDDEGGEDEEGANGPSDADLREMRKAHLLLRELWRAAPQVLSNVVPQLEAELSADNVYLRKLASETLGDMISGIGAAGPPPPPTLDPAAYPLLRLSDEPVAGTSDSVLTTPTSPHSFAQTHPHVYQSFLNRKNDKSALIRTAWVTAAGYILSTSAGGIGLSREEETALVLGLGDKLNDSDEKVRLAAVKAIECFSFRDVMTKLAPHGGVLKEGSVLANLADRGRDRKAHVRVEAMALLGKLWAAATGELAAGDEAVTAALGAVPSRVFNAIYANDQELNLLVDRIAYEYLVPLSYPAIKKASKTANGRSQQPQQQPQVDGDAVRAERILLLVRSLDTGAKRAFFALQSRQPQFSRIVEGFLKQCEAYNGGVGEEGRKAAAAGMEKSVQYLAQFFPDAAKVKADLQRFAKLNDRRSYQLVRFVTGPEHDFTTMYRAMKELVKKLQASNAAGVLDTLLPLLYRSGCIMFNRSHLTTILEYSKGGREELAATANEMLKEVSQRNPGLFKTTIGELCKELATQAPTASRANDPIVMDSLKACASYAAKYPQEVPREAKFAQAWIRFALYGRPEQTAKYAVKILLATRDDASTASAKELAREATQDWKLGAPRFLNRLVAVSQLARLTPAVLADSEETLRREVMDILRNVRTEAHADDPAWAADDVLDEEGRAKVLCLQFLVQQLLGSNGEDEATRKDARNIVRLLVKFVAQDGEATKTKTTPAHHRSRLRLAAAQALLKICAQRQFDELLTPADFNALALVAQDPAPEVRHRFVEKLQKYLVHGRLRPRFYTIVFLCAFEPNAEFRHQVETWIRSRVRYFQQQQQQARQPVMEGLIARLIALLAHHPDFTTAPDEQIDHARYILFYLQTVASEANLGLINKYAERVKQTLDGLDPERSENLYLLSDLTQATIRRFQQRKGWALEPYGDKVGVPQGLYAPLPSHDVALTIARKQYISDGLEDQIDDLIKATERKKKRRSADDYGAHDPHAAKRTKTAAPRADRDRSRATPSSHKKSSASRPKPKKTPKAPAAPRIPDSERRRSGRSAHAQHSYIERDSDEDDDEMLDGVAEWEYLDGSEADDDEKGKKSSRRTSKAGGSSMWGQSLRQASDSEEEEEEENDGETKETEEEEEEDDAGTPPASNGRRGGRGGNKTTKLPSRSRTKSGKDDAMEED